MTGSSAPPFAVISGTQVQQALAGRERQVTELVEETYRLHGAGDSVNPPPTSCASRTARRPGSSRCPPRSAGRSGWTG
jgi:hypothetical protein